MNAIDLRKAWNAATIPPQGWQGDLYFHNRIGQKIRYGHAPASPDVPAQGSVVLTHGYSENIDLYYETIKTYQSKGYHVWAMDWQGHGKSERDDPESPLKPSGKGMLRHTHDLDYFVNNIVRDHHDPAKKLIMSTHSMGGHIGLLYLRKFPGVFDAAVMSAPMFDIYRMGLGRWAQPLVRFIFNAASALGLRDTHTPANDDIVKACKSVGSWLGKAFRREPTLRGDIRTILRDNLTEAQLGRPTFGWIANTFKTIIPSMGEDFLGSIKTPVLIASAGKEDLVANDAHERAVRYMPNATHIMLEEADHNIWASGDTVFHKWWGQIDGFLDKVSAENPHECSSCEIDENIADGENIARTLKGRVIRPKRCEFGLGNNTETATDIEPSEPDECHPAPLPIMPA